MEIDIYDPYCVFSVELGRSRLPLKSLLLRNCSKVVPPPPSSLPPSPRPPSLLGGGGRAGGMTTKEGLFPRGSSVVRMKMRSEGRGEEMEKRR